MSPVQILISILAIVVPILMTVFFKLIGKAFTESLGRLSDRVAVVDRDLREHKEHCDKIDKAVLETRLKAVESVVFGK